MRTHSHSALVLLDFSRPFGLRRHARHDQMAHISLLEHDWHHDSSQSPPLPVGLRNYSTMNDVILIVKCMCLLEMSKPVSGMYIGFATINSTV